MNDDPSPNGTTTRDDDGAETVGRNEGPDDDDGNLHLNNLTHASPSPSRSPSRRRRRKRSRKKRSPGLAKKLSFVTHLLKTIDLVVFAELSALYYMECSLFRFMLRAVGQYMYLTPKDEAFPFLMPASRLHVLLVVIPNFICLLLHAFGPVPYGPDFHRGYQHGGLIIDFIGQQPPTYKLYYALADLAIFALQCFMLSVHTQREQLRVSLKTFRPLVPGLAQELSNRRRSAEDLDAEERGILREGLNAALDDDDNGLELQSLHGSREEGEVGEDPEPGREGESSLRDSPGDDAPRSHLFDVMTSGNAILGEYHLVHSIKSAAIDLERSAAQSIQTIGYGATVAALRARRRRTHAQPGSQEII
ncbi:hypothetical protein DCS_07493 [Drechmeria coniospora]|uniref:DUF1746 domain-containing protein n=1 Tax=Drechmeria coniospora TaxID=98403 RepID=A0A151GEK7_DRECN|nr:hypothetical protein DCS_07493 [Drechmeria coniospora]KYK55530.1 hypothetical protein DCS_07493 [Drechmeria coniospora]ODA81863.1 hypothetical protein RJ55_00368 [Drechmeria coniospora]